MSKQYITNSPDSHAKYSFTLKKENLSNDTSFAPGNYTWKINAEHNDQTSSSAEYSFIIKEKAQSYNKNSIIHNHCSRFHCFYRVPSILLRTFLNSYFSLVGSL